ncbi:sodium-hydrogen antiporter [Coprinopsis cinerea AmutBmut pab1-1]|nr:sodium-hydrogen antiporter [Coprinopsis cinerea AmutBmut pab1-1]
MAPIASSDSPSYYEVPALPVLLSTASFLYLLRVVEYLSDLITNTHLLGSLLLGILWASPHVGNLLNTQILSTFTLLGYIGLLLLIFEAGLTTPLSLLLKPANLALSMLVAAAGIAFPFALTFGLLHGAFGYTILQSFGAGAALCSTSLGTTIALLNDEMRTRRVGVVLMTAALADDVVGLVIAGIVANLGGDVGGGSIHWSTIVRPILVSLAFTVLTPVGAVAVKKIMTPFKSACFRVPWFRFRKSHVYLFTIVATLTGFVAGSHYAGTSELYGAYLAGTFLSYVFAPTAQGRSPHNREAPSSATTTSVSPQGEILQRSESKQQAIVAESQTVEELIPHPIESAFAETIQPLLINLLSPLFFASIGASLPVQNLFSVHIPTFADGETSLRISHDVIWKGIVYSMLMVIAKVATGLWILVWPDEPFKHEDAQPNRSAFKRRLPQALFLGLAMVARGEIALVVAQLAAPLLTASVDNTGLPSQEPFAVVIWAILLTTVCGAVGVGIVLRRMEI